MAVPRTLKVRVGDVFTESGPATYSRVQRPREDAAVAAALRTRGLHPFLVGPRWKGKTTTSFAALVQAGHPYVRVAVYQQDSLRSVFERVLAQLTYIHGTGVSAATERDLSASISLLGTGVKLGRRTTATTTRALESADPRTNVVHTMLRLGAIVELSEAHNLPPQERVGLSEVMKEISDRSPEAPSARFVITHVSPGGSVPTWIEQDLLHRVQPIPVMAMTMQQVASILPTGAHALNVEFAPAIATLISLLSGGEARVCQRLARRLCEAADVHERRASLLRIGLQDAQAMLRGLTLRPDMGDHEARVLRAFRGDQPDEALLRELVESARVLVDVEAAARCDHGDKLEWLEVLEQAQALLDWVEGRAPERREMEPHFTLRRRLAARLREARHQLTEDRTAT